jgi:asparagine synthase (glutamine-hydrolysing)
VIEKTMQFYVKLYLQDDILVKTDRAGMMNSLEVRAPFLDLDVVNFIRRLPTQFKIRRGRTKWLLRRAARQTLPADILRRPKHGFPFPAARAFREGHLSIESDTISQLDTRFVSVKHQRHVAGHEDNRMFLWSHWLLAHYHAGARPS